jgi:hypothetical protein
MSEDKWVIDMVTECLQSIQTPEGKKLAADLVALASELWIAGGYYFSQAARAKMREAVYAKAYDMEGHLLGYGYYQSDTLHMHADQEFPDVFEVKYTCIGVDEMQKINALFYALKAVLTVINSGEVTQLLQFATVLGGSVDPQEVITTLKPVQDLIDTYRAKL